MPELPEVETTLRGIAPLLTGERFTGAVIRQGRLRRPVTEGLADRIAGARVTGVTRRAKYLLLHFEGGYLMIHLGMSGSLRMLPPGTPPAPHDHVDLLLERAILRYRDPRRFGLILWGEGPPEQHPLLQHLGVEPLQPGFDGEYLHGAGRGRSIPVKGLIMDQRIVVGVGNIYASESLYLAGIDPRRAARRISLARYQNLAHQIRQVLERAIEKGGTTLRDFQQQDGRPGYFQQQLNVYAREGEGCPSCGGAIRRVVLGQRSTFFCGTCQR